MISCDDFSNQLSDYLEGAASEENGKLLGAHLASCSACARKYSAARLIVRSFKNLPRVTASENFSVRLHRQIHQNAMRERNSGSGWIGGTVRSFPAKPVIATMTAAAVIALAVVAADVYLFENDTPKDTITPRLEIPPLPESVRKAASQPNPLMMKRQQVGGLGLIDSSTQFSPDSPHDFDLPDELRHYLQEQSLSLRKEK